MSDMLTPDEGFVRHELVAEGIDAVLNLLTAVGVSNIEAFDIALNVLGIVSLGADIDPDVVGVGATKAAEYYSDKRGEAAH